MNTHLNRATRHQPEHYQATPESIRLAKQTAADDRRAVEQSSPVRIMNCWYRGCLYSHAGVDADQVLEHMIDHYRAEHLHSLPKE